MLRLHLASSSDSTACLQFACCTCKLCNLRFMPQQASISTSLTPLHLNCIKFGSALLGTWCESVMTRLKGKEMFSSEQRARRSPWAFKSRIIIRHCASWLQIEAVLRLCEERYSTPQRNERYFVWNAPGSFNHTTPVETKGVFTRCEVNRSSLNCCIQ